MKINVLSAYQTTAEEFFNKILGWKATLVLDIRLKNTNQLSGFTKQEDLEYFTHVIAHADYVHDVEYSPTKSLLDAYLDAGMPYEEYFKKYGSYDSIAIVGTATKKRHSHAEELLKLLKEYDPSITS